MWTLLYLCKFGADDCMILGNLCVDEIGSAVRQLQLKMMISLSKVNVSTLLSLNLTLA